VAWLVGPDDLEALVDEDVMWPVDADVVDLVLAVAGADTRVSTSTNSAANTTATTMAAIVGGAVNPSCWP
jgi:hypothetical protein